MMFITETLNFDGKEIFAICLAMQEKNLIVLRAAKGYVMCGYLNMAASDKFNEVAVKIAGVSTIEQALDAKAGEVSHAAQKLGITPGMPVREILKLIT